MRLAPQPALIHGVRIRDPVCGLHQYIMIWKVLHSLGLLGLGTEYVRVRVRVRVRQFEHVRGGMVCSNITMVCVRVQIFTNDIICIYLSIYL